MVRVVRYSYQSFVPLYARLVFVWCCRLTHEQQEVFMLVIGCSGVRELACIDQVIPQLELGLCWLPGVGGFCHGCLALGP